MLWVKLRRGKGKFLALKTFARSLLRDVCMSVWWGQGRRSLGGSHVTTQHNYTHKKTLKEPISFPEV